MRARRASSVSHMNKIVVRRLASFLLITLGVIIALVRLGPAAAQIATQQQVFGPKQYFRTTGAPNQYVDTFSLPSSIHAPFVLHVVNGDPKGGHRVSAASVEI